MRKALQAIAVIVVAALLARFYPENTVVQPPSGSDGAAVEQAYATRTSGRMLHAEGRVVKLLADDREGDRHQKFILRLASGHTILVSHNIDIAPRIDALREGDSVSLYGQYEWNERGGVVHWTHHAPRRDHEGGWIDHAGRRYE